MDESWKDIIKKLGEQLETLSLQVLEMQQRQIDLHGINETMLKSQKLLKKYFDQEKEVLEMRIEQLESDFQDLDQGDEVQ